VEEFAETATMQT